MRIGTFKCWLFGHKFTFKSVWPCNEHSNCHKTKTSFVDNCVRCGISKQNN